MKFNYAFLMDKAGDSASGGDAGKELSEQKSINAQLIERLNKLEASGGKKKVDKDQDHDDNADDEIHDQDLNTKVKKDKDRKDKLDLDSKALESALTFTLGADDFIKTNQSLLPKDIADIFKAADKETYSSKVEKASAIKSGIVQSFFGVQSNLDLLTMAQKSVLEDYLKLTKAVKEQKAQEIYQIIFEPTLESLRRVQKATEVALAHKGFSSGSDADKAYKEKMMNLSKKHYLGEKI